jgi:hypothetical protein
MVGFEVRSTTKDGTEEVVMAPRVGFQGGQPFAASSQRSDEKTGQHRQIVISGYPARDGRSIAAVLTATAIWIDPADGREYYFVQPENPSVSVVLHPLASEGKTIGRLTAGVATPRPMTLRVYTPPQ